MKKIVSIALLALVLMAIPLVASAHEAPLEQAIIAGWNCQDIAGAMHCFDPGDAHSANRASVNVKVFDYEADGGGFQGTEQLWSVDHYAGQPCPQSELLDLRPALPFIACHHYSH